MKKPILQEKSKFHQGFFRLKNPQKYVGDPNDVQYRSSWEMSLFYWLDNTPGVIKWGSETLVIPYVSPVDNKPHRYFTDVWMQILDNSGNRRKIVIEVKPLKQTRQPVLKEGRLTKKQHLRQIEEMKTWAVNRAKWQAAKEFCQKNNMEFVILTEREILGRK